MPALPRSISRASLAAGGAALVAAVLGYSMHHVGPLQDHALESVVLALGAAMLLAGIPAAVLGARETLPQLLVAVPGSHRIRTAEPEDARFCAALHAQSLPHGFFTRLGPRFLRAYHATFFDSPHAVAYIATVKDMPVGMLVGVLRPRAHSRWLMRHRGLRLAMLGAAGLALHPMLALRFVQRRAGRYTRGWRRHRRRAAEPDTIRESAVLSHIAVLPGARRSGSGRDLVKAFVETCRGNDVPRATLLTLDSSEGAGPFYSELGWRPGDVRTTPDGHRLREWTLFTNARVP